LGSSWRRGRQGEALGEGQQVGGQGGDLKPDPILGQVVEGQVAHPGVLGVADAVFDAGVEAMS
jgi:hypothetical protein